MKPPALLAILAGALVLAGAFLYWQGRGRGETAPAAVPLASSPASASSSQGPAASSELLARFAELVARVDALETELASTRASIARAPSFAEPIELEGSADAPAASTPRDGKRSRGSKKRAPAPAVLARTAEPPPDDLSAILDEAAATARRVGLSAEQEKIVGDLLLEEREKERAIRDEAERRGPSRATKAWALQQMEAVGAWKKTAIAARLGPDVARAMQGSKSVPSEPARPSRKKARRGVGRGR